jgi:hypothetical protein
MNNFAHNVKNKSWASSFYLQSWNQILSSNIVNISISQVEVLKSYKASIVKVPKF